MEINCETDFVAKGDIFKELVSDIAMQVLPVPGALKLLHMDPTIVANRNHELQLQMK